MGRRDEKGTFERTPKRADLKRVLQDAKTTVPETGSRHRLALPGAATTIDDDRGAPDSTRHEGPQLEAEPNLGRYQLLFELARGGMGTVHVGRLRGAHGFDRLVAIKQLKAEGATEEDVEAFLAEARITARLNHPNVVQTLELGEHEGRPFIVMELIRGVSLARLLRRIKRAGDRLQPHMAMWIAQRVATGLHAAHERALIHRDVSPENVILSFEGRVCVADFGVAKFTEADKQTQSGVVKGKFAYMSPEQTEAAKLDRRSDIFALGIVLHEALTGERLFAADTMAATIRRIWSVSPPDPSEGRPEIPRALVALVMRCLEKERNHRYDTAEDVATELRKILRSEAAVVDDADLVELIQHYFPTEKAHLLARIEEAVDAVDSSHARRVSSRELEISPSHRALSAVEQTQQGSVTASITTGPPLSPRSYAGAGVAAIAAVLIGGGLWLSQRPDPAPAGTTERAAEPPAPTEAQSSRVAPSAPPQPTQTPTASASATVSAAPAPLPPRSPAPKALPELKPTVRPPPAPTRGKPIDIFGE